MAEDQTNLGWLARYGEETEGTGVFLGSSEDQPQAIILARDVSHQRCAQIAQEYTYSAFKWIPSAVATYAQVEGSRCAVRNEPCETTCKGLACLCDPNSKTCVDARPGGGWLEELAPAAAGNQGVLA